MKRWLSCAITATARHVAGCTYYMPAATSSASIGNKSEVPVKIVSGRTQAKYFGGFGPFGDDSLQAALEDARRRGNLAAFVLREKAKTSSASWKAELVAGIPENEQRFVSWFVNNFTSYKIK